MINIDKRRNYYNCGGSEPMVRHCKSQRIIGQERKIKYKNNTNNRNNLKEKESLVVLD